MNELNFTLLATSKCQARLNIEIGTVFAKYSFTEYILILDIKYRH